MLLWVKLCFSIKESFFIPSDSKSAKLGTYGLLTGASITLNAFSSENENYSLVTNFYELKLFQGFEIKKNEIDAIMRSSCSDFWTQTKFTVEQKSNRVKFVYLVPNGGLYMFYLVKCSSTHSGLKGTLEIMNGNNNLDCRSIKYLWSTKLSILIYITDFLVLFVFFKEKFNIVFILCSIIVVVFLIFSILEYIQIFNQSFSDKSVFPSSFLKVFNSIAVSVLVSFLLLIIGGCYMKDITIMPQHYFLAILFSTISVFVLTFIIDFLSSNHISMIFLLSLSLSLPGLYAEHLSNLLALALSDFELKYQSITSNMISLLWFCIVLHSINHSIISGVTDTYLMHTVNNAINCLSISILISIVVLFAELFVKRFASIELIEHSPLY